MYFLNWHLRKFKIFYVGSKFAQALTRYLKWLRKSKLSAIFCHPIFNVADTLIVLDLCVKGSVLILAIVFIWPERTLGSFNLKDLVNLSCLKNGLISIKDCVLYEWKIAGFFYFERLFNSFILLTRKIDQIFQIKRTKRSFRSNYYKFEYWNKKYTNVYTRVVQGLSRVFARLKFE